MDLQQAEHVGDDAAGQAVPERIEVLAGARVDDLAAGDLFEQLDVVVESRAEPVLRRLLAAADWGRPVRPRCSCSSFSAYSRAE
jgi:hypothetical protein